MIRESLKNRKLKIFFAKRRRAFIMHHEALTRTHHKHHYGAEKLKWEWGTIDHLGLWAIGWGDKDDRPNLKTIQIECPKAHDEKVVGWYCYMGPIPESVNTPVKSPKTMICIQKAALSADTVSMLKYVILKLLKISMTLI